MVAQLSGRKYYITEQSKIRIESKDAVKKRGQPSPDEADCILLCCLPVKPREKEMSIEIGSKKKNLKPTPVRVEIVKANPVRKADTITQITPQEGYNAGDWINQPVDFRGLRAMVQNSSILPQCIRAYKSNIAGFGIGIRYTEDVEETEEMKAEWDMAEEVLELLSMEKDTKEVFEDIIDARETYGISYLEVIRNLAGEVRQIEFIRDTPSVEKTKPLDPYITISFWHHGKEVERKKRFCKYKQQLGGKTVYFKEFGDPRIMDNRSGEYLKDGETLELQYQANEILEFAIGTEPYGEVRWVGQILGVDGSRKRRA